MKSIAFGQYYPAESPLHRLDPRIKIIMTILYIVCSFLCKNILSYALLLVSAIFVIANLILTIIYEHLDYFVPINSPRKTLLFVSFVFAAMFIGK